MITWLKETFLKECDRCGSVELRYRIKQRWYKHPVIGKVKSEAEICPSCCDKLTKMFSEMRVGE